MTKRFLLTVLVVCFFFVAPVAAWDDVWDLNRTSNITTPASAISSDTSFLTFAKEYTKEELHAQSSFFQMTKKVFRSFMHVDESDYDPYDPRDPYNDPFDIKDYPRAT